MLSDLSPQELFNLLILLFFGLVVLIQLLYFWGIFSRLAFYRKKASSRELNPVSVVICARNEYRNIKKYLPQILDQEYPDFEVVVVDDGSDDDTQYLLKHLSEQHSNLRIVNIKENLNFFSGKKFPLAIGIKSAKNDIILLTDADCRPSSTHWIRDMQSTYLDGTEIVLGYGKYEPKAGLLDKFIRYDTVFIAMQYLSYALAGIPYMGVGRNLSYRKSLFYRTKGFISHYKIRSGDDDLFINKNAKRKNTRIEISSDSHTVSEQKRTFEEWFRQKKRHLTTGRHYRFQHKFFLGTFAVTQFLFYVLFIILIINWNNIYILLSLFFLRTFSAMFIFKKCMLRLKEKNILLYLPLFELFFIIFNPLLSISATIFKDDKWK